MTPKTFVSALMLVLLASLASAQTPSAPASTVNWLFAACDSKAVIDLTGTMQRGYDIYLQLFRETQGRGKELSGLIQVPVDGEFRVSRTIPYPSGEILALGQFASIKIIMAREGNPKSTIYETIFDDVYDTCIEPAYGTTTVNSTTPGALAIPLVDPQTGLPVTVEPGQPIRTSGILKPGSGYLNPVFARPAESIVQIGARPSQAREQGRVTDVGLLFAECDQFPGANPGTLYDTDNLTVFWSWYARTAAQVRDHMAKVQYTILFETPLYPPQPFINVQVSPVVRRPEDRRFWVFYTVNLGDRFVPGTYRITYQATWTEPTFDGWENFGPGTANEVLRGSCTFTIEKNPYGVEVSYQNPKWYANEQK